MSPHVVGFRETGYERIGMLPRFRDLTLRPRFSVIALTALVGLAVPVTASAAVLSGSPTQALVTLNAGNTADASSSDCIRCSSLAGAYQIIYASDQPRLSRYQIQGLNHVRSELIALQFTGH